MVQITVSYTDTGTTPPVFVAGSFTDWQPIELEHTDTQTEDGTKYHYKKNFEVSPGDHHYKFRLGPGDWWVCDTAAPHAYDAAGNENNVLVVEPPVEKVDVPIANGIHLAEKGSVLSQRAASPTVNGIQKEQDKNEEVTESVQEHEDDHDVMQNTIKFNEQQTTATDDPKVEEVKQDANTNGAIHKSPAGEVAFNSDASATEAAQVSPSEESEHNLTTHIEENGFVSINKPAVVISSPQDTEVQSNQPAKESLSPKSNDNSPKIDMSAWKSADKPQPAKSAMKQPDPSIESESESASDPKADAQTTSLFYRLCCGSRNVVVAALIVGLPVYLSWRWAK